MRSRSSKWFGIIRPGILARRHVCATMPMPWSLSQESNTMLCPSLRTMQLHAPWWLLRWLPPWVHHGGGRHHGSTMVVEPPPSWVHHGGAQAMGGITGRAGRGRAPPPPGSSCPAKVELRIGHRIFKAGPKIGSPPHLLRGGGEPGHLDGGVLLVGGLEADAHGGRGVRPQELPAPALPAGVRLQQNQQQVTPHME